MAYALRTLGDVYADDDSERARSCFEEATEMATQLGMRPLVAHCQFGLGELSKRRGDFAAAGETLRTAVALYGGLDMESWRQRAESVLSSVT